MKQHFFDEEDQGKPYESFQDWYKEIKYLIWPAIITLAGCLAVYVYFRYFHF